MDGSGNAPVETVQRKPTQHRLRESKKTIEEMIGIGILEQVMSSEGPVVDLSPKFKETLRYVARHPKRFRLDTARTADEYFHFNVLGAVIETILSKFERAQLNKRFENSLTRYASMVQFMILRDHRSPSEHFEEWQRKDSQ